MSGITAPVCFIIVGRDRPPPISNPKFAIFVPHNSVDQRFRVGWIKSPCSSVKKRPKCKFPAYPSHYIYIYLVSVYSLHINQEILFCYRSSARQKSGSTPPSQPQQQLQRQRHQQQEEEDPHSRAHSFSSQNNLFLLSSSSHQTVSSNSDNDDDKEHHPDNDGEEEEEEEDDGGGENSSSGIDDGLLDPTPSCSSSRIPIPDLEAAFLKTSSSSSCASKTGSPMGSSSLLLPMPMNKLRSPSGRRGKRLRGSLHHSSSSSPTTAALLKKSSENLKRADMGAVPTSSSYSGASTTTTEEAASSSISIEGDF